MDFAPPRPPRRMSDSNIVPMINVVFLLLIFFLMSARIAPPDPVKLTLPQTAAPRAVDEAGRPVLYLDQSGTLIFGAAQGDAALAALPSGAEISLRSDAAAPGAALARLLVQLRARGIETVHLTATPGAGP